MLDVFLRFVITVQLPSISVNSGGKCLLECKAKHTTVLDPVTHHRTEELVKLVQELKLGFLHEQTN